MKTKPKKKYLFLLNNIIKKDHSNLEMKLQYGSINETENRIHLTWENINVYVPDKSKSFLSRFKKAPTAGETKNHIIQNGFIINLITIFFHTFKLFKSK